MIKRCAWIGYLVVGSKFSGFITYLAFGGVVVLPGFVSAVGSHVVPIMKSNGAEWVGESAASVVFLDTASLLVV